jgi:hypothetical protein
VSYNNLPPPPPLFSNLTSFSLTSKHTVQQIYDYLHQAGGSQVQFGLTFPFFIEFLDQVAQNCSYSTKNVHGPYSRVRTMFHVMNSSRGRIKLARDSSETIINPLTALDSAEPVTFHAKPSPSSSFSMKPSPTSNHQNGHQILRSQSMVTPPSNAKRKSTIGVTPPPSLSSKKATPKRSASIGTPRTPSSSHLNGRITPNTTPSSVQKMSASSRGNLKSEHR